MFHFKVKLKLTYKCVLNGCVWILNVYECITVPHVLTKQWKKKMMIITTKLHVILIELSFLMNDDIDINMGCFESVIKLLI